ncbi:MAG: TolC family protein [Deltaproteobacteria bacterium]|nr:TolC family protein [Deltaproteobacteria bacterium]
MRPAILVVLVALLHGARVHAQDASEETTVTVTWAELEARLSDSPRLVAAHLAAEAGEGDVIAAGTPENPLLSLDFAGFLGGEPTNGGTQSQIVIGQTLPWPGQLDARVRAAQARLVADRSLVTLARAYARLDLRRAYVALLAAQDREALLAEAEARLSRIATLVTARSTAGAGRRWDVVRIEAELAALRSTRDAARGDVAAARGRIAALLGRPGENVRAPGTLSDLAPLPIRATEREHPRLAVAQREIEAAEAAETRERAWAVPPIQLRVGAIVSSWPEGGYLLGGLSMPLPFVDQNRGAIERAAVQASAARAARDATSREVEAARIAAERTLARRREALERFAGGVSSSLATIGEMAEIAFRGGEIDVFELLDSVRATRELVLGRIERDEAVRQAEIDLVEATTL